ncbi:tetratricopeptide repeat protein [Acetobacter thailandicus]|uniref:tetratricopeptide repeat protein n=1 Tax=Acetobacter thailandicus TaxID=1502842 RepID=UPI001BA5464E|nr:tetratricopeptide repeat protein [Acetobacter thailandicus]MBS1003922.1 tetratricopeptide repeat protein [Acetobacter thailandicus]
MEDCLGNVTTVSTQADLAGVNDFINGFLGYHQCIAGVLSVAETSHNGLVHIYAGLLWMLSETGGVPPAAREHARKAQAADGLNAREQLLLHVLLAWLADDMVEVRTTLRAVLTQWPRDLIALKIHQYDDFNNGRALDMLRVTELSLEAAADNAHFQGMRAFAFEQCHLLDHAEEAARKALAIDPQEGWAQHALAHVMLTRGRIEEGLAFLSAHTQEWERLTSFLYTHLWWHKALFHLSLGQKQAALAIYDRHCWARERTFSQDQAGAVSLLLRLEFAGCDVGARWQDLGAYLVVRKADVSQPFLSLHYLYGLLRAGLPEGKALLAAIRQAAGAEDSSVYTAWHEVGLALAEALSAHAERRFEDVLPWLDPVQGRIEHIGGSHAQRDLFGQLALDAMLRIGADNRAQQILEMRRLATPGDVPANNALATLYASAGLPALAAEATARGKHII